MVNDFLGILIFVVCNGIGFYALYKAMSVRRKGRQAAHWPTVSATIQESALEEEPGRNAMGSINVAYVLTVKYSYVVAGKSYHNDRVSFGKPAFNFIEGSNYLEQFEPGKQVSVYYNPENQAESVLAPKTTVGMPSWIIGAFFIFVGMSVGIVSIVY